MESGVLVVWTILIFSLRIPWIGGSVYSGTDDICSLSECTCTSTRVECSCTPESSFQESFKFRDDSRKLRELIIQHCDKLILPPQSISAGSYLTAFTITNVSKVEFQPESLAVSRHQLVNVSAANEIVFHQQSFKSFNALSPTLSVVLSDVARLSIRPKAFASIKEIEFKDISEMELDPLAFKLEIPYPEPVIDIRMKRVKTKTLSTSTFSSSLNTITIQDSVIDNIQTGAFSGNLVRLVALLRVSINRIDRAAFSDQSVIERLVVHACNISSLSQKAVVAGISEFNLTGSVIQSIAKYGAVNVTVANVHIHNNSFRTLGEESFNFISWNLVSMVDNTIHFMEEGAINAIHRPVDTGVFEFSNNKIGYANRNSLVTRLPLGMETRVSGNMFQHLCDCNQEMYIYPLTGHSGLSSPFQDLSSRLLNTSLCRVPAGELTCFPDLPVSLLDPDLPPATFAGMSEYADTVCEVELAPGCLSDEVEFIRRNTFYEDFLVLFQVKTTKGILLFVLVVVLACLSVLTICVGAIWVHRLCIRAKLVRDKYSGSFQFNSGEDKPILFSCSHNTNNSSNSRDTEEPQYAEIAEIHPTPRSSDDGGSDLEVTTLTDVTTLPQSTTTTLPSLRDTTLPSAATASPLPGSASVHGGLVSMSTLPPALPSPRLTSTTRNAHRPSVTTLPATSHGTPVANIHSNPLHPDALHSESDKLLPSAKRRDSIRMSMSETSLTDEIMMALRDKLNDPTLYCTVMDAKEADKSGGTDKAGAAAGGTEEDLYCAPIYSDPNQIS